MNFRFEIALITCIKENCILKKMEFCPVAASFFLNINMNYCSLFFCRIQAIEEHSFHVPLRHKYHWVLSVQQIVLVTLPTAFV